MAAMVVWPLCYLSSLFLTVIQNPWSTTFLEVYKYADLQKIYNRHQSASTFNLYGYYYRGSGLSMASKTFRETVNPIRALYRLPLGAPALYLYPGQIRLTEPDQTPGKGYGVTGGPTYLAESQIK
jgi:hypothetical protein